MTHKLLNNRRGEFAVINIAICDDNNEFIKTMHQLVKEEFTKQTIDGFRISDYSSAQLLLLHHKSEPFDVIFLDIDMPKMTGFDLAKELNDISKKCYIVFVSCHSELVFDSLYFSPLNFITKGSKELVKTILHNVADQLFQHLRQNKHLVLENKEQGRKSVSIKDILYVESNKHHVIYHFSDNKETFIVRDSIGRLQEQFIKYDFVRVHKKYLVNLRHIFNINKSSDTIIFKQGFELPMSRNFKTVVKEKLTEFIRKQ